MGMRLVRIPEDKRYLVWHVVVPGPVYKRELPEGWYEGLCKGHYNKVKRQAAKETRYGMVAG